MKKGRLTSTIGMLLFLLTTGALLTGCSIRYSSGGFGVNVLKRSDAKEFAIEEDASESITSINICTRNADVELIEADKYYVEINYLYWDEAPEYGIKNGELYFDDQDCFPNSYSINFSLHNEIKIYLPKDTLLEDLKVTNSSGDVTLAGFAADSLDATISYGDFALSHAAVYEADITLSSGSSKISDFEVGKLEFTNSYGNAKFSNINTGDDTVLSDLSYDRLQISMSSGNVTINQLKMDNIDIDNSYGDITLEKIVVDEMDIDLSSGKLDISDADLKDLKVSNSYGDVALSLKGTAADYNMDLDTSYGKIVVDGKAYEEHYDSDEGGSRELTADLSSGDVRISFKD